MIDFLFKEIPVTVWQVLVLVVGMGLMMGLIMIDLVRPRKNTCPFNQAVIDKCRRDYREKGG
jgi:hypothetical protein